MFCRYQSISYSVISLQVQKRHARGQYERVRQPVSEVSNIYRSEDRPKRFNTLKIHRLLLILLKIEIIQRILQYRDYIIHKLCSRIKPKRFKRSWSWWTRSSDEYKSHPLDEISFSRELDIQFTDSINPCEMGRSNLLLFVFFFFCFFREKRQAISIRALWHHFVNTPPRRRRCHGSNAVHMQRLEDELLFLISPGER